MRQKQIPYGVKSFKREGKAALAKPWLGSLHCNFGVFALACGLCLAAAGVRESKADAPDAVWSADGKSLKGGAWMTPAGLARGRYWLHAVVGEDRHILSHEGISVDFSRGSAWRTENGKEVMTVEAGPLTVGPNEVFRVGDGSRIRSITLARSPLAFAPQKFFTNPSSSPGTFFSLNGSWTNGLFTAKIRNLVAPVGAADVSVTVTDYFQRELGRVEKTSVPLVENLSVAVPFAENASGQYRATVRVRDAKGREAFRVFPLLRDAKTPFRECVRMNDGWTRQGRTVTLPGEILGSASRFGSRRTIPASVRGRRLFVRIMRIVGVADLLIDGKKAATFGTDGDENGIVEADVTDFVKPGAEQQFVFDARPSKTGTGHKPGIGEVSLEARPAVALGNVRITTSFREKTLRVETDAPSGHTVRHAVYLRDEKLLSFADSTRWENPPLWGPFDFPLLRLVTELVDAEGRVVDAKETRFGFREIWTDGMALVWNGHRVKGDARAFMSTWGWDFDRRCKRQENADLVWFNKRVGVKFLRHIYNGSDFLDFCDEAGLLVAKGGFTPSGPSPEKDADDAFWVRKKRNDASMIASYRHHPSVMAWYLSNEYRAHCTDASAPRLTAAVEHAKALDPTRFAEAGCDIDMRGASQIVSTHYPAELGAFRNAGCFMPDCFYWRPVDKPFGKGMMVPCGQVPDVANITIKSPIRWGEKPICINETCWDWFFAPPFGFTRIAGDEVFADPGFHDKWHIETNIEAVRGHRDADATLWTTWRWIHGDPIARVSPEIDVVNVQRHHVFHAGTDVSYDVNCFYDVWKPTTLTWFWQLEDASGRIVVKEDDVRQAVGTSALLRKKIRFTAPERSGEYRLRFGLRGLREATLDVSVRAKEPFELPANVIPAGTALSTNLLARAAAGETIVLLAREDYPEWLPEIAPVTLQSGAILRTFRPDHPVLAGISEADLRYFHPKSIGCCRAFAKPSGGNARTVIEFGGPSGLAYSALLEVPYGKGCFLYSRLVLEPEANPVATALLKNMAAHRRVSAPGKALFLAGGDERLAKALRVRCGVAFEEGAASDAAKYAAVFVDGSKSLPSADLAALRASGKTVFVFNPGSSFGLKRRAVKVAAWKGRAVRVGRDPLTDGLTDQDLMWRTKYDDAKTAAANLGTDEFATEEGVLLYPAYAVRRGNFVFLTADPDVHNPAVDTLVKRFWATFFGNAGVAIRPFVRPTLPKKLFYRPLDVSAFLDRTITEDETDNDGKGSWMDQGKAQSLPMSFRHPTAWVGMVPYDVKRKGPGAFALATENRKGGYSNVVIGVGRQIETVNWLYSATWCAKGKRHYSVILHYADGTAATVYGQGGVNVNDCFDKTPDFTEETETITSCRAFRTPNPFFTQANVYSTTWVNPHPDRKVATVEFVRGEFRCARIGIFAVTVGEKTGGYERADPAKRAAVHDKLVAAARAAVKAKDDARAIACYEKALRVRPELIGVYRSLGKIYESEGDWESALTVYRRALEAEYNQPDIWEAEKAMLKKLGRTK